MLQVSICSLEKSILRPCRPRPKNHRNNPEGSKKKL